MGIDYIYLDLVVKIWMNFGEVMGVDVNNNGVDDGCEDNIDGDNNGYLNDCYGVNMLVNCVYFNGVFNFVVGDLIDDIVGYGINMVGLMIV